MKVRQKSDDKRLIHFDFLRVISMTFVLLGHVLQRYYVVGFTNTLGFTILYSVSLSLFFFTSGYFIKRCKTLKELGVYLFKLIATYLFPAYLFTVLSIFLLPRFAEFNFSYWMNELYLRTDTFYWFFLTLFFINAFIAIVYYLMTLIIKKPGLKWDLIKFLLTLVCVSAYAQVFVYIYQQPELGPATLASNQLLYYLPLSFIGFSLCIFTPYYKNYKHLKLIRILLFVVSTTSYIIALSFFPDWLGGLNGSFLDIFYRILGSIAGVVSYYLLALFLARFSLIKSLSRIAKYSGPLYLVHVFLIRLIYEYMPRPTVFDQTTILFICLWTILFYLGSLATTILLVEFPITNMLLFGNFKHQWRDKKLIANK
ncbi:MAG: acyltransferase [Bacilli bacterium]|jgi:peptidoglycan/LPS O-acetylase OafA/YrhL|nr:acyltransferase [Bacilli bacterium]MDD3389595.1 acyltransferase [Bacilli bacterium]MDD4345174.1 acyltransferase [Bacilli bacterium]MDD4521270.1 acyltransferase [Bacilli bacterium]MDY0399977.1 acyltransferase [Bacilli bacterium]